jgi:hypothetical protein
VIPSNWRFRRACISSHIDKRWGCVAVAVTHGGQSQHYGWPVRSVGIEWSWRTNTWFIGWELWPAKEVRK